MSSTRETAPDRVLRFLRERTGRVTQREIILGTELSKATVATALRRLLEKKEIAYAVDDEGKPLRGVYLGLVSKPAVSTTAVARADRAEIQQRDPEDYDVTITIYTDLKVSAGPGTLAIEGDEATATHEVVGRVILRNILGFDPPPQMQGIYVEGTSMIKQPRYEGGDGGGIYPDQLVFFVEVPYMVDGRRYVLRIEDRAGMVRYVVKRVYQIPFGGLRLASDNPAAGVPDDVFLPDDDVDPESDYLVHQETGRKGYVQCVGAVLWPHEDDSERVIRTVQQTVETMRANGILR